MTEAVSKLCLLAVDDSPFSRKLLERALSGDPYSLLFAENGNGALQLFKEHRPPHSDHGLDAAGLLRT